jgi:hypothetical protein
MSQIERKSQEVASPKLPSEQFSRVSDSLIDYQFHPQFFTDIDEAITNNRFVVILLTHQSYFDIEACRHICELINRGKDLDSLIESYLMYSSPAVGKNIDGLLKEREDIYKSCNLKMLGIIRPSDYENLFYKEDITPDLEKESEKNKTFYNQRTQKGGCISFIPFEATLKSGRIDPDSKTGDIFGMRKVENNLLLISAIKQKALIIPCGIDGSYKVVDPNKHQLSNSFKEAIFLRDPPKIVTLKTGQPIDLSSPEYKGKLTRELYNKVTLAVAGLVSPAAQGEYRNDLISLNHV